MNRHEHKLTARAISDLVKPLSFLPASILPTLFAGVLSLGAPSFKAGLFCALLLIAVLMHSSANAINDYFDFIKGTDTVTNSPDKTNAILFYHISAKAALMLGIAFLVLAALLGIYVTMAAGPLPLIIGLIGAMVAVAYSTGPLPLSYLPLGELASGLAMGGLLPLAVYAALNGRLYWPLLLYCLPFILGIGLVMMTNNICDVERDRVAGRRTLPLLLGRETSRLLYRALLLAWLLAVVLLTCLEFSGGWFTLLLILWPGHKAWERLLRAQLTPPERGADMAAIFMANMIINTAYTLAALINLLNS